MNFVEALKAMKNGAKVKLPSWGGYQYWDEEKQTIMMHTKNGKELDIRETQRVEYTLSNVASDEWGISDENNCPVLGGEATFSFSDAIRYLKRGLKVKRKGWNGKNQYIELAKNISYVNPSEEVVNAEHEAIGNHAIAFVGTSGLQIGWIASQADMLAEDWVFVEQRAGNGSLLLCDIAQERSRTWTKKKQQEWNSMKVQSLQKKKLSRQNRR